MRASRLMDYWKGADGYCRSYVLITKKYTLDDMSNILTGNIKYGIKEKYLKEKEVIDIICKAVNQKIEMDNHSNWFIKDD